MDQTMEGPKSKLKRTTKLILAVTLHNIPEGMAVGVVYAGWLSGQTTMKAYRMPGKRYDIGNLESYEKIRDSYRGVERS